jgi:hypothetical protein
MGESEYALHGASDSSSPRISRIVNTLLQNSRMYKLWESRHADLLLPVAEHGDKKRQIMALRDAEVRLVHRRALFRYLRANEVRGDRRRQLFRIFHSTLDYHNAILTEHRQYMLAVSSRISADHLIDVMNDPKSKNLSHNYEKLYTRYFEMQCYVMGMGDSNCIALVRSVMADARDQLRRLRRQIEVQPLDSHCASFDRQEVLARSGRYPVLEYMVG